MNCTKARLKSVFGLWPKSPAGLTAREEEVYLALLHALKKRIATGQKPPRLVVIMDIAKDYDGIMAMVLLTELHRLGLVQLEGVIANLMPASKRARLGRGVLDMLGREEIPIAVGSKGSESLYKVHDYEFKGCSFLAPESTSFLRGEELLSQVFKSAIDDKKRKLTLVLLSSPMDISNFIFQNPDLVRNTVDRVIIQGGMYFEEGGLKADKSTKNNQFALDHALYFAKYIQDNGISTTVYTDALDTKISGEFFGQLQATGHPLGIHIRKAQIAQDIQSYKNTINNEGPNRPPLAQHLFLDTRSTWFFEDHAQDPLIEPYPSPERLMPFLMSEVRDTLAVLGSVDQDVLNELKKLRRASNLTHQVFEIMPLQSRIKRELVFSEQMADSIKALVRGALLASRQRLA